MKSNNNSKSNLIIAFGITLFLLTGAMLWPFVENIDITTTKALQILSFDEYVAIQRKTVSKISDTGEETSDNDKATGQSSSEAAINLARYPNIRKPRFRGRVKDNAPKLAQEKRIGADCYMLLTISNTGIVTKAEVKYIVLKKNDSPDVVKLLKKQYAKAARANFIGQRYEVTMIDGKAVPIILLVSFSYNA